MLTLEAVTHQVIGAAIEVHRFLGPGLLENVYHECLCHELSLRGIAFESEAVLSAEYKGLQFEAGYRSDLIVARSVIVEIKAVEQLLPVHSAQLLTYMKLAKVKVGLLVNFNVPVLVKGIVRRVL